MVRGDWLRLGRDESAASPLTVITIAVLVAGGITALVVMSLVGGTRTTLQMQQIQDAGGRPAFQVTNVHGRLDWPGLTVQFIDPAGTDQAGMYLQAPNGTVELGNVVTLRTLPPGGVYLVRILQGETELARVAATF